MRIQKRCFLLGLCLLGRVTFSLTAVNTEITTLPDNNGEDILGVQSVRTEWRNDTTELKNVYPTKEADIKITTEAKKKSVMDFKVKGDQKYQKSVINDDPQEVVDSHTLVMSPILPTILPETKIDQSSAIIKPINTMNITTPFLLHGVPIVAVTKTILSTSQAIQNTTSKTVGIPMTEETISSRGRDLNVTVSEPMNSLHANITDLSDISMDENDKEVEGGEYIASHNETTTNISSTLFPKASVCIHENRTYSVGENIVRDCEEKCICSESGITNCQPLCIYPYVKVGRELKDHLCQEKLVAEEPCCALIFCPAGSDIESNETCVFNNKTVTIGQRVEDGCSRVCICEAGGHLKCKPRPKCPPNETVTNQHDRCVVLIDPGDKCCTVTLCDVTLSEHEVKSENSTDLNVHLMDVKVLNSTAIKLKLSTKNPQDVTIEISQNNHVWRQQNLDKDGIISNLEPAHTYSVRVAEGSHTSIPRPAIQVLLPAEVVTTNMSEKITDKNTCNYRGKSYKVGAEWYDECISFCTCTEDGKSECATIECPTDFGLDLLDPNCLDWETVPANFVPEAPQCCPQEVHCRNNGSCTYEGVTYENWTVLPSNVTGCERRCYCEMGNVSCQAACKFVPALPPAYLPCPSHQATLTHVPTNPCCTQWTCSHPSAQLPGLNVTTAYPGPLATNTFDQQTIDNIKRSNNKSEMLKPSQEPEHSTSFFSENSKTDKTQTDTTTHKLPHYPMDPGHPIISYNGPYSPDYLSTHLNVEDIFHLPVYSVKPMLREKSKSKLDSKKPVELRPHKEIIDQYFPGPLVLDKFPDKATSTLPYPNENQSSSLNLNKLAPSPKDHPIDQAQFIPLHSHPSTSEPGFLFTPSNRENISQVNFNNQYGNTAIGLPYYDSIPVKSDLIDPNVIVPIISKKKTTPSNPFIDAEKSKPFSILSDRPKQNKKNPDYETLPEKLHHLTNSQHPDLIQFNHTPPQDYPGIYDLHQQISGQKQLSNDQAQSVYFGTTPTTSKKTTKYHSFSHKDENGQITYHIHTPNIPNTPQQIEELLAHINQHDPNPGPFQDYSRKPAVLYNVPNGPLPTVPLHIDAQISHSGLTHLNHPLAAQTSSQSGMDHNIVPPGFSLPGSITGFPVASPSNEVTMQILEALDEHTIRLVFTVPQVLVGLHGRVELQYTSDKTNFDPSTWKAQVFAPPNNLIATPQLEFELGDLKPMTEYKVKITVKLKDLANSPTSKIYSVRTLEKHVEVTTLPPQIPIDAELRIAETNSTWVNVMWKKFTEYELQFIDGVQLRYKEYDSKVYAATPLIHRAVTNYVIENLKPSTTYEVGIYFIPFPGQLTELMSEKTFQVTTFMEPDPYSFDVKVEVKTIKSTDVEVSWSGVPYPEDKYVNIYRAIYQSDTGKEDTSTFKIAKRDSHAKTMINDLKPGTRYRLWLEIYLTNGRIKKSNVQDFVTKPGVLLPITVAQQAGKFATLPLHDGDYYGPLVVVAIVASLAILSTLILSMMLMKRRTSSKADISPRKTTSAYDNPSYKTCEDAITIPNRRNKITADHEMAIISVKETA
ncbi:putative epidermal cell surface receptor isoform X1 [Mycetomoellerius zeteki]|uniref:putative epidermal cell surface receptor isoform X1 n=1 Tax=Mycetomoellerius zeteki TaxID=64791 RepID=UPI00084E9025|nr:PREDICTED: putative epidermal cell surface receptor isoform X1 [Trachymyrmex zeteki]